MGWRRGGGRGRHQPVGVRDGLALKPVRRVTDLDSAAGVGAVDRTVALLHHVRQLMRDHVLARIGGGVVLVALEHDVRPDGVGLRVDRLRRIMRGAVAVDADVAEVRTEPALHVGADVPGQRRATGGDHVVDRRALLVDEQPRPRRCQQPAAVP